MPSMTGRPAQAVEAFEHEALVYRDDEDFATAVGGFLLAGLAAGDAACAVVGAAKEAVLREALGADAAEVDFVDMQQVGGNPARILPLWGDLHAQHTAGGRGLRGVGEPVWPARRPPELDECELHEALLDTAFAVPAPWRLLCPYDASALPAPVIERARAHHPFSTEDAVRRRSAGHDPRRGAALFAVPLEPPPERAVVVPFDGSALGDLRGLAHAFVGGTALCADRVDDLVLALHEVTTNSVRHGGGRGRLSMWSEPAALVLDVVDGGRIGDPLAGRSAPSLEQLGGRGLWLVNQLCDLVQLRSSARGTNVRLRMWLA